MTKPTAGELTGTSSQATSQLDNRNAFTGVSKQGLNRWKKNTFGMFIHWGLYCHRDLAGYYQGQYYDIISEWLPHFARIPMRDYKEYASDFNPSDFDADQVTALAKSAGMNYMVVTAKHHDGFAMYHSPSHPFNITDATPFKRDPVAELSQSCRHKDLDFGLYYSHVIDWENENAVTKAPNDWDFNPDLANYQEYWNNKCLPQVNELLEQYGDLCSLWFDMGGFDVQEEADHVRRIDELMALIRKKQPDAVVNSRVTAPECEYQLDWDIKTGHDNYMEPLYLKPYYWEGIATSNDNWGYSRNDNNTKSSKDLINQLCSVVSRGGNFLLNITLDHNGRIPQSLVRLLSEIGQWMQVNQEAVIDTEATPLQTGFNWGVVTHRPATNKLYLHVQRQPEQNVICLHSLKNRIKQVRLLDHQIKGHVSYLQKIHTDTGITASTLNLQFEHNYDRMPLVIELEYDGELDINPIIHQDRLAKVRLDTLNIAHFDPEKLTYRWTFQVERPGRFALDLVSLETMHHKDPQWVHNGKTGRISCAGQSWEFELNLDKTDANDAQVPWKNVHSRLGELHFPQVGEYTLEISELPLAIDQSEKYGQDYINLEYLQLGPRLA